MKALGFTTIAKLKEIEKPGKLANDLLDGILELYPEYWPSLDAKGWGLYKQGKYQEVEQALAKQSSEM